MFTDAIVDEDVVQVIDWLVAVFGVIVAVIVDVAPVVNANEVGLTDTPVTGMFACAGLETVTNVVAVNDPSTVVAVIVAVPAETAVITPLFTDAIVDEDVVQVIDWLVAVFGVIVAVIVDVAPVVNVNEVGLTDTPVTGMFACAGLETVTNVVAVNDPSTVVAVIVAVPAETAVTTPLFTDAIVDEDVVQVIDWLVAVFGVIVAVIVDVAPVVNVNEVGLTDTPVTGMFACAGLETVTNVVAVNDPSNVVAVIVAVPAETAVITPLFTDAIVDEDVVQVIDWLVAVFGVIVAVIVDVAPVVNVNEVGLTDTPVTGMFACAGLETVTNVVAVNDPSTVVAVIVAVPAETAVITPLFTDAIVDEDVVQVIDWLVAVFGVIDAVIVDVAPVVNVNEVGLTDTPVTGMFAEATWVVTLI